MSLQNKPEVGAVLPGMKPCDGWVLRVYPEDDSDGFTTTGYVAVRDDEVCLLGHCRFDFTPTQERFDWLVREGFPRAPGGGPWTNAKLDWAITRLKAVA